MSSLYNHSTGKWVEVADSDVDGLVQSGNYTFAEGTKIPVVSPDGKLGTIPGENATKAFKAGFRWATPQDKQFDLENKNEAIKRKAYGDMAGTAFAAGALKGATLGLSDVVLRGAEEIGILSEGFSEARREIGERSPIAEGIGTGVGVLGTMGVGGPLSVGAQGTKLFKAGEKVAAQALAKGTQEGVKRGLASRIIEKTVPIATGSAVEGAFYGLGEGISEAALGNPDEIVNNLVSNVTFGGLTGGAFGGLIGAGSMAKPALLKVADGVSNVFDKAVAGTARTATKLAGKAALNAQGEVRLAQELGDLIDTPVGQAARQMAREGKWDEVKGLVKEAGVVEKEMIKESKDLARGLNTYLSKVPEADAVLAKEVVAQNGGNLYKAVGQLYNQYKTASRQYVDQVKTLTGPRLYGDIDTAVYKAADALEKIGTKEAKSKADELYNMVGARSGAVKTEGDEVMYLRALKSLTNDKLDSIGEGAYDIGKRLVNDLDGRLKNHPNQFVAESQAVGDSIYSAMSAVRNVLGKQKPNQRAITRLIADPEYLDTLSPALTRLSEFSPELKSFAAAAKGSSERIKALTQFKQKLAYMRGESVDGKLSTDDIEQLLIDIGADSPKIARVEKLKEIQETLAGIEKYSPIDRAIRVLKATGQDASKLESVLPYQKQFDTLDRLQSLVPDGNFLGDVVSRGVRGAIGGALGGPTGAALGVMMGGGTSVRRMMNTLTEIERLSNKGAKLLNRSMKATVEGLTSERLRKVGVVTMANRKSEREEKSSARKNFKPLSKSLAEYSSNPQLIADNVDTAMGNLSGIPGIKQAMATKMAISTQYLAKHIPKDPMAGRYLNANRSNWEPSDSELYRFNRRVAVVHDPKVAMDKIADGSVTPEEIDALRSVYPEIFEKLKADVTQAVMEKGDKIPYDKRITIGTIFGVPTDPSLEPEMIGKLQSTFDVVDEGGRPDGATDSVKRKPKLQMNPGESETAQFQQ
jgi:hypothetical protein